MDKIKIKKLFEGADLPTKGNLSDAGYDLYSSEKVSIHRHAGVIDSGYRGHIKVCLHNASCETYHVERGDRIAQMVVQESPHFELELVESLDDSDRGESGFGSTGK